MHPTPPPRLVRKAAYRDSTKPNTAGPEAQEGNLHDRPNARLVDPILDQSAQIRDRGQHSTQSDPYFPNPISMTIGEDGADSSAIQNTQQML